MEIRNLHHMNVNAVVTSPFSLSWSEDNKIAVVTKEGLVIMVFSPEPGSDQARLALQRTIATVTTETPASFSGVPTTGLVAKLEKSDVYKLVLDVPLDPNLTSICNTRSVPPRIVQHCWSPAGSLLNARCLLSVVTTWGQCSLRAQCVNMWPTVGDVSAVIAGYFARVWEVFSETDRADRRWNQLQARADKLITLATCWGQLVQDGQTRLVAAQRSGDIVLLSVSSDGQPTVQGSFPSNLQGITAIQVLNGNMIAAGDRTGCIRLFTLRDEISEVKRVGQHPAAGTSEVTHVLPGNVGETKGSQPRLNVESRDLWAEADNMQVTQLLVLPHTLVAFKGSYLLAFSLVDLSVRTTAVDSFSIAGGVVLSDDCIAMATQYSAELVVATVTRFGDISCTRIPDVLQGKGNMGAGLARSKGGALWAVLACNNQSTEKSAASVCFFNFVDRVETMMSILSVEGPAQNLSLWFDHLEVARINVMNKRLFENETSLPAWPERLDGLSLYQLRVWRWIYLMKAVLMKRMEKLDNRPFSSCDEQHPLENQAATIEGLIVAKHLCSVVEKVAARLQVGTALSSWELQSVYLARGYLAAALPDLASNPGPTVKRARRALNMGLSADVPTSEACSLCGDECLFNSYETSLCKRQHNIPRCAVSLLQVHEVPYLLCVTCGRIAHPRVASFTSISQPPTCVFCERILETVEFPGRPAKQPKPKPSVELDVAGDPTES